MHRTAIFLQVCWHVLMFEVFMAQGSGLLRFVALQRLPYAMLGALSPCLKSAELQLLLILQCAEIAEHLAGDMARENLKGKTLTLKLKTTAFEVRTRAHSLPQHISTAAEIEAVALRLLKAEVPIEIRLMGMRMSHFLEVRKEVGQQSIAAFVKHQHDGGKTVAKACSV